MLGSAALRSLIIVKGSTIDAVELLASLWVTDASCQSDTCQALPTSGRVRNPQHTQRLADQTRNSLGGGDGAPELHHGRVASPASKTMS